MKKEYMEPTLEVVELKIETHLLAGSTAVIGVGDTPVGPGGWAESREPEDLLQMLME